MTPDALNKKIEKLCERKGLRFRPWETPPHEADDGPSPFPPGTMGDLTWRPAQRLRRALIAELTAAKAKTEVP